MGCPGVVGKDDAGLAVLLGHDSVSSAALWDAQRGSPESQSKYNTLLPGKVNKDQKKKERKKKKHYTKKSNIHQKQAEIKT